jgi:DNA (cytosine-5)-methyltransferase 1/tRNA (cytosine38-C5)-methyltransferase
MRAIELFAGLGGLRLAAPAGLQVVAAYDQDEAAARTYESNHGLRVTRLDLASVRAEELDRHEADTWLLSPPCQPFTSRGARRDVDDPRCAGLLRLVALLAVCRPGRLFLENVPGFHGSRAHGLLRAALLAIGLDVRDVEACPSEQGARVRRRRQFVVAGPAPLPPLPPARPVRPAALELDPSADDDPSLRIPDPVRARVADRLQMAGRDGVLGPFTRSYGRAISGAGPVHWDERGPRWFSPEEILRLHEFPTGFRFPDDMPRRTRWRLAGNSVHVGCVRRVLAALACAASLALASCTRTPPAPRDATPPPAPAAARPIVQPDDCAPCHAREVEAWLRSGHRLAARPGSDTTQPSAVERMTHAAPDVRHVLGGRRREDFLALHEGLLRVLPTSWSVVRSAAVSPVAEELGTEPADGSPLHWTGRLREHRVACARCHPVRDEAPGLACSTCHGDPARHVLLMRGSRLAAIPRSGLDAPPDCATCHASGWPDHPAMLASPTGTNPAFWLDGRPANAHAHEALAFMQSACARKGGATCVTCHDPHGGVAGSASLREPDPDTPCRTCHPSIAAKVAAHAHHPAPSAPPPFAPAEPSGPAATRLPACVDCHAPAIVPFGRDGRARDHAFGPPHPESAALGVPDACSACHGGGRATEMARTLDRWFPGRDTRRRAWATAFSSAISPDGARHPARVVAALAAVVEDVDADPLTRASAALLLSSRGPAAVPALPTLARAAADADPLLAEPAVRAYGRVPGASVDTLAGLLTDRPVGVRLAAAAALDALGDPRGADELERLRQSSPVSERERVEVAFELGRSLLRRGALQRAELVLAEVVSLAPTHDGAWLNLGVARAKRGDRAGAEAAWRTVLELSPDDPLALANLRSLELDDAAR